MAQKRLIYPQLEDEPIAKRGRGPAAGGKEWGTENYKMQLNFNPAGQVCGPNSTQFSTRLGIIARCGVKAPLYYEDWRKVPKENKEEIWKEIKEYTNATEDNKEQCMKMLGNLWRSWKYSVKTDYYDRFSDDPEILLKKPCDRRVRFTDWQRLVAYWRKDEVVKESAANKERRKQNEFCHTTEKTSFADIRLQMEANGEDTSRPNVFRRTQSRKNGGTTEGVAAALTQIERRINLQPPSERTPEFLDNVFTQIMGEDGHERCRTHGLGPTPTSVNGPKPKSTAPASNDIIQKMVAEQVDANMAGVNAQIAKYGAIIAQLGAKLAKYEKNQSQAQGDGSHGDDQLGSAFTEDELNEFSD